MEFTRTGRDIEATRSPQRRHRSHVADMGEWPTGTRGPYDRRMEYRRLGTSGLKVSALGLGSWVTFGKQLDVGLAADCMAAAFEGGVNFFDNAEVYAGGESERVMGAALARLGWERADFVVSTKFFGGIHPGVNTTETLNRKYLLQAIGPSLDRLGLDFVDLVYCHSPDPETPIEETVWAMHDIVSSGRALYWGTSNWPAEAIREAVEVAERHHLRRPVVEQPQYNLLHRDRVERFLAPVCASSASGSPRGALCPSGSSRASTSTASRRRAARASTASSGSPRWPRTRPRRGWPPRSSDSPGRSAARRHSSRSPGASAIRTSRRSSPAPAASPRFARTSAPWMSRRRWATT